MRPSDLLPRPAAARPLPLFVVALLVAALVGACGTEAVAPSPSPPPPSATPTPDPHLTEPASVGDVFAAFGRAGLRITANNADSGGQSGEPRKRINATYAGWPLILSEFSSQAALVASIGFQPDRAPRQGEAPFMIVGLNILVEYGPHTKNAITKPDKPFIAAAQALVDAMDPLLSPLAQSSTAPLDLPREVVVPSGEPSEAPASAPAASPSS